MKHRRGIHHRLACLHGSRGNKAADDGNLRHGSRNLLGHALAAADEGGFFQQVTRRITANGKFGEKHHLCAGGMGPPRKIDDLFCITAEIANGWIDLSQGNFHIPV